MRITMFICMFLFQISESFKKFGMADNADSVLIVLVNDHDGAVFERLRGAVEGTEVPVESVAGLADEAAIRKVSVSV